MGGGVVGWGRVVPETKAWLDHPWKRRVKKKQMIESPKRKRQHQAEERNGEERVTMVEMVRKEKEEKREWNRGEVAPGIETPVESGNESHLYQEWDMVVFITVRSILFFFLLHLYLFFSLEIYPPLLSLRQFPFPDL